MLRTAIVFLLLTHPPGTKTAEPLCVLSPAVMPENWRAFGDVHKSLSAAPWSAGETKDAAYSVRRGAAVARLKASPGETRGLLSILSPIVGP